MPEFAGKFQDPAKLYTMKSLTRLAFVGPMLGCHSGYGTVIGEILARLFARNGYQVVLTSTCPD